MQLQLATDKLAAFREIASDNMHELLRSALADTSDPTHAQRLLDHMLQTVVTGVVTETHLHVKYNMADDLEALFSLVWATQQPEWKGPAGVPSPPSGSPGMSLAAGGAGASVGGVARCTIKPEFLPAIVKSLNVLMQSVLERRSALLSSRDNDPDFDDEERQRMDIVMEADDGLISNCTDTMGYCIKMNRAAALPALAQHMSTFLLPYLANKDAAFRAFRVAALCMCIDVIEYASPEVCCARACCFASCSLRVADAACFSSVCTTDLIIVPLRSQARSSDARSLTPSFRRSCRTCWKLHAMKSRSCDRLACTASAFVRSMPARRSTPLCQSHWSGSSRQSARRQRVRARTPAPLTMRCRPCLRWRASAPPALASMLQ